MQVKYEVSISDGSKVIVNVRRNSHAYGTYWPRVLILSRRPAISRLLLRAKSPVTFYSKANIWTYINETQMQVCRDIFVVRTLIFSPNLIITQIMNFITFPIPESQNPRLVQWQWAWKSLTCRTSTWRSFINRWILILLFLLFIQNNKNSYIMFSKGFDS